VAFQSLSDEGGHEPKEEVFMSEDVEVTERPWWDEVTPEIVEAIKQNGGIDYSEYIGKHWFAWGRGSWGEDVFAPADLAAAVRIVALQTGRKIPEEIEKLLQGQTG